MVARDSRAIPWCNECIERMEVSEEKTKKDVLVCVCPKCGRRVEVEV